MDDKFTYICETLFADVEKRIGRPMNESQKEGVRSSGSFMFLEAITDQFYFAKSDEEIEAWLSEMNTFRR